MAKVDIMCAADGPTKCKWGPWRGTRENGWCDAFNVPQPYLLPPGVTCCYADSEAAHDTGGVRHPASNSRSDEIIAGAVVFAEAMSTSDVCSYGERQRWVQVLHLLKPQ
jgi:hypothetical protein